MLAAALDFRALSLFMTVRSLQIALWGALALLNCGCEINCGGEGGAIVWMGQVW